MAEQREIAKLQVARINTPEDQRRATEQIQRKLNELIELLNSGDFGTGGGGGGGGGSAPRGTPAIRPTIDGSGGSYSSTSRASKGRFFIPAVDILLYGTAIETNVTISTDRFQSWVAEASDQAVDAALSNIVVGEVYDPEGTGARIAKSLFSEPYLMEAGKLYAIGMTRLGGTGASPLAVRVPSNYSEIPLLGASPSGAVQISSNDMTSVTAIEALGAGYYAIWPIA